MSFTRVDFPEPLTPVTATKTPSGIVTSTFLKLFSFASLMVKTRLALIARRFLGISIFDRPEI